MDACDNIHVGIKLHGRNNAFAREAEHPDSVGGHATRFQPMGYVLLAYEPMPAPADFPHAPGDLGLGANMVNAALNCFLHAAMLTNFFVAVNKPFLAESAQTRL